ncbi:Glycosyltransferase involved in cell wall bisynthesis [Pseudobutyrivibrio sp. OR37]|uniref:glycosyltransferase n=1 Tax=Pseudobutyrivibrio sp. OR37 TaxID=1798186 RepID=UPI0008EF0BA8|nr:glycosyltransferase [Pseudobutyrivibrio sp. OR37]SFI04076.1 Glycosyltransferase involved in cell wall bisynthesis [Pseudobutyrivibrio sp. OR37]
MKKVLIIIPHFFPGFKIGGPQRTIENVVDYYGEEASIYIYTKNHDMGEKKVYEGIETKIWLPYKNAKVMYMPDSEYYGPMFYKLYKEFNIIYSCSLFANNSILLLLLNKGRLFNRNNKQIFIAPMGVLEEGAFSSKSIKKKVFLYLFAVGGFFKNVIWSFSSENEKIGFTNKVGAKYLKNYIIAEDLPRKIDFKVQRKNIARLYQKSNSIVFLSRICEHKNLLKCIEVLMLIDENVNFDIYGVVEDKDYWKLCEDKIAELPNNIKVRYCGQPQPFEIIDIFSKYDIFMFPTKGENYGHVVFEALASGCIPVISNKTPWSDIEQYHCGKIVDLDDNEQFRKSIKYYMNMSDEQLLVTKKMALDYAEKKMIDAIACSGYENIFK